MSNKRQQKRAKQVRRTNVRAAQRAKHPPTPAEVAMRLVRDFAVPLASRDPLDAELVASATMGGAWTAILDAPADEADAMPHPALPVVGLLRNLRVEPGELADAALALAHALAAADPEDPQLAAAGGVLVEQLREAGARDPAWAGTTGRYELVSAHDVRDVWMDEHQLVLAFRDSEQREHALVATIDRIEGFQFSRLEVIDDHAPMLDEIRAAITDSDDSHLATVEELSPARAGGMLQAAIEGTFDEGAELLRDAGRDELDLLHLVLRRHDVLDPAAQADPDEANATPFDAHELDEVSRDQLAAAFDASEERTATGDEATPEAVELLLDWVHQLAYPRALFGPVQVQDLLLDHVTHQVRDEDARASIVSPMLAATRAWARYCARLVGLEQAVLDDVLQAVDHYAPQFEQAMHAPPGSMLGDGHTGADLNAFVADMTERMRDAGVDLDDAAAVREWMTANAPH